MTFYDELCKNAPTVLREEMECLSDTDEELRILAALSLQEAGYRPAAMAMRVLLALQPPAVTPVYLGAINTLAPELIKGAREELRTSRDRHILRVARTLFEGAAGDLSAPDSSEKPPDPDAVAAAIGNLRSSCPERQVEAAQNLGSLASRQAVPPLRSRLARTSSEVVAGAILAALLKIDPEEAYAEARQMSMNDCTGRRDLGLSFLANMGAVGFRKLFGFAQAGDESALRALLTGMARWCLDDLLNECSSAASGPLAERALMIMGVLGKRSGIENIPDGPQRWKKKCLPILETLALARERRVYRAAAKALVMCSHLDGVSSIRKILDMPIRRETPHLGLMELMGLCGGPEHKALVLDHLRNNSDAMRAAALQAACRLCPGRVVALVMDGVKDRSTRVVEAALSVLQEVELTEKVRRLVLALVDSIDGNGYGRLLSLLEARFPENLVRVVEAALQSEDNVRRRAAVRFLPKVDPAGAEKRLGVFLKDRDERVRVEALQVVSGLNAVTAEHHIVGALTDRSSLVRLTAVSLLGSREGTHVLEELLPRARDVSADVRRLAIRFLARFDDPRVLGEILSSLNDVQERVRAVARALLEGKHGDVPSVANLPPHWRGGDLRALVKSKLGRFNSWATGIGRELLGRPVSLRQYRQGLGRTRRVKKQEPVEIEVSDTPLLSGHPHGEDITRGLVLHELGHHLCDFAERGFLSMRGNARADGVDQIFDILIDERLERQLRARRGSWGIFFDRLASYAFSQEIHRIELRDYAKLADCPTEQVEEGVTAGCLPGRLAKGGVNEGKVVVLLRDIDFFRLPGALPALTAFLWSLRCGFDSRDHPDPRVAAAVALVPSNLRVLSHGGVLRVARAIADVLGDRSEYEREKKRLLELLGDGSTLGRGLKRLLGRMAAVARGVRSATGSGRRIREAPPEGDPRNTLGNSRSGSRRPRDGRRRSKGMNLNPQEDFNRLTKERSLTYDPQRHGETAARIRRYIRRLRWYLAQLGLSTVEEHASRRGRRVDIARLRSLVYTRNPSVLIGTREEAAPDLYLGILIDRSGSMRGERIQRARAFGTLVAESAKDLPGIVGHVSAFDDTTFYTLGGFRRNAIASLQAGDGNNDAGGLSRAAELALQSGKRNKLIIMISDGLPTECTFVSLKNLVHRLTTKTGIVCVQVAVKSLEKIAFPHYVDLSAYSFDGAVSRFGRLLMDLKVPWR